MLLSNLEPVKFENFSYKIKESYEFFMVKCTLDIITFVYI